MFGGKDRSACAFVSVIYHIIVQILYSSILGQSMRRDYLSVNFLNAFNILAALLHHIPPCGTIQCFSCKATASNEIEANIHCLEKANLEDCSDFYQYYSEIENDDGSDVIYEYEFVGGGDNPPYRRPPVPNSREFPRRRARLRRQADTDTDTDAGDYQYAADETMTSSTTRAPSGEQRRNNGSDTTSKRQMSLPTDPEHHCYSTTKKNGWESYTVDKGCKKIEYCRANRENMPAVWTLPWNFCCDRSRCNAKLVKDKPQRIFAMGCRRTDDCIQGHNTRHVCPQLFQSCPRISSSVIKMECRVRHRGGHMAPYRAPAYGNAYFNQFKDKKCFCARGYYPRGPVCSRGALSRRGFRSFHNAAVYAACAVLFARL